MPNSVLIVDDSPTIRTIMRDFFEALTDWKITGEAGDGSEAIQIAAVLKPDLILLDFSMPNMNGLEAAPILKKLLPDALVVVFTMFEGALGSKLTCAPGVDLVISKADGLGPLVEAVHRLMETTGLSSRGLKQNHRRLK